MEIRDVVDRMRRAYELEDWTRVVDLGESIPGEGVSSAIAGPVHLFIGRALFSLGRNAQALARFESGFQSDAIPEDVDVTEFAYFAGMASMIAGDLERARRFLGMAIERGAAGMWAVDAAMRGLAQVETELGSFDEALSLLDRLAGGNGASAFNHVLRARVLARRGDARAARWELSAAGGMLPELEPHTPPSELMTAASMLVGMAEVYVELGHAAQAHRALDACTEALERADWPQIPAAAYLLVFRAAAHRLDGRHAQAERLLDASVPHVDAAEDLAAMVLRERARLAAELDDVERAAGLWREAALAFEKIGYRHQAAASLREITHGPPAPRPHPSAADELALMAREMSPPDGVIVSLCLSDDDQGTPDERQAFLDAAHQVEAAVDRSGCGEYDGWEIGGGHFTIFCYGDPGVLWPIVQPLVRTVATSRGGSALLRRNGTETSVPLEDEHAA